MLAGVQHIAEAVAWENDESGSGVIDIDEVRDQKRDLADVCQMTPLRLRAPIVSAVVKERPGWATIRVSRLKEVGGQQQSGDVPDDQGIYLERRQLDKNVVLIKNVDCSDGNCRWGEGEHAPGL